MIERQPGDWFVVVTLEDKQRSERAITRDILRYLNSLPGVYAWKVHGSPHQPRGMPDVACSLTGRYVALEIKRPGETPTPAQKGVLARLAASGAWCGVVYSLAGAREAVEHIGAPPSTPLWPDSLPL